MNFECVHISEFISELIKEEKIKFNNNFKRKVTFQDPCRLGRHLGIYDAPRTLLNSIPGVEFVEMENNKTDAVCCGTSAWMNCSQNSKQIQLERMKEAKSTGADILVTGCPKCQIHLKCAVHDEIPFDREEVDMEINDLTVFVAKALEGEGGDEK